MGRLLQSDFVSLTTVQTTGQGEAKIPASNLAARLKGRYFRDSVHPYRILERELDKLVTPDAVILDAGCGRHAPVLTRFIGRAKRLIGIDLVEFPEKLAGIELYRADLGKLELADETIDIVYSRSVMEHIEYPDAVFAEMNRVLKPGGYFIFLTANKWDYASIIASIVPNRWHPIIVNRTEGRAEEDVFPTRYRANTYSAVKRLALGSFFEIVDFKYLGQYPNYFMFSGVLFFIATMYEKLIARVSVLNFLQGWILVILRKAGPVAESALHRIPDRK